MKVLDSMFPWWTTKVGNKLGKSIALFIPCGDLRKCYALGKIEKQVDSSMFLRHNLKLTLFRKKKEAA